MLVDPLPSTPKVFSCRQKLEGCTVAGDSGGRDTPLPPLCVDCLWREGGSLSLQKRCNPATPARKSPQIRTISGNCAPKGLQIAGATMVQPQVNPSLPYRCQAHRRSRFAGVRAPTALQPCNLPATPISHATHHSNSVTRLHHRAQRCNGESDLQTPKYARGLPGTSRDARAGLSEKVTRTFAGGALEAHLGALDSGPYSHRGEDHREAP